MRIEWFSNRSMGLSWKKTIGWKLPFCSGGKHAVRAVLAVRRPFCELCRQWEWWVRYGLWWAKAITEAIIVYYLWTCHFPGKSAKYPATFVISRSLASTVCQKYLRTCYFPINYLTIISRFYRGNGCQGAVSRRSNPTSRRIKQLTERRAESIALNHSKRSRYKKAALTEKNAAGRMDRGTTEQ